MQKVGSNYVVHELLGSGATGEVWRGADGHSRPVAVKLLRPEFSNRRDVVRRFIQERELLTKIEHPHVVQVHDLVYDRSMLAIVMDLIGGGDLAALLFREGPLSQDRTRSIATGVALGLAAIHAADIVHLDLKPGNVLLARSEGEETALIADLGVSQLAKGPTGVAEHPRFGTPQYTAPEIVTGGAVGSAADVYALGLLMIEMLQGKAAFDDGSDVLGVLDAQVTQEVERPDGADDETWRLISSMISKDPESRPTALDVAVELGAPQDELGLSAFHSAVTEEEHAEDGVDRPLFPRASDPSRSGRPAGAQSARRPDNGPPTTQLGHRTSHLRSAQTVALNEIGPRTVALPQRAHSGDPGAATPAEPLGDDHAAAAPHRRRGRRWALLAVAAVAASALVATVGVLVWRAESPGPPPPTTSASSSPTETSTPTATLPPDAIGVPNVIGMTEQAARQQIHGGLRVDVVSVAGTADTEGTVTGTDPEVGTRLSAGDTVTLQVARELATQRLSELPPNATTGRAKVGSAVVDGSSYPASIVLTGETGIAVSTINLQKRYMSLEGAVGVPDDASEAQVQISLDQVPVFDETIPAGSSMPLELDLTDAQQMTVTVTTTSGDMAEAAVTDGTLFGEKGRVPGS